MGLFRGKTSREKQEECIISVLDGSISLHRYIAVIHNKRVYKLKLFNIIVIGKISCYYNPAK